MRSPTIFEIDAQSLQGLSCFEPLFEQLSRAPRGLDRVAINMESVDFVTPAGALALAMVVSEALQFANSVELIRLQGQVPQYLERMDLLKVADDGRLVMAMDSEPFYRSEESANLVEIQLIPPVYDANHGAACKRAISRLGKVLEGVITGRDAEGELLTMLSELVNNIRHSRERGYVVVQKYRRRTGVDEVVIAVGDLGDGIRTRLSQMHQIDRLPEDSDYIRRALRIYRDHAHCGKGLARVEDLVRQWDGTLVVRSGCARVTIASGASQAEDGLLLIPGTQVEIVVRAIAS